MEGGKEREGSEWRRKGGEGSKRERKGKGGEGEKGEMNVEQRGASNISYKDQLTIPTSVFLQSHSILEVVLTRDLCCPCQQRPHHHCGCSQC